MENIAVLHTKVEIKGTCSPRFSAVREAFAHNLDSGQDIGASVAVFVEGEPVVDLWGGHFDGTYTRPFAHDTIVQCYSSTKTITALCALFLADRGAIDLDAPVARYWPEFAANGKGGIAIRQVLGHTAGLCGWDVPMTFCDLYDWEKATTLLARQAPLWEPGRTSGYHGFTQGPIIGEVIRRVTGKTMGTFLAEAIAAPLGVAGQFYIGTPAEADDRVSLLIQGSVQDHPNGNRLHDLSLYNPHPTPQDTWALEWRRAELGGMGGHGNARGIATLQSLLACGEANGKRLMSDAGRTRALEPQSDGVDLVIGVPCRWGMGFSMETAYLPGVPAGARAGWWAGNGGSMSYIDLDARMAIGYTPNRWISGPHEQDRSRRVIQAAYESLAL
ncbi:MAG: beta-lactamase family protein [Chloroflexales bacterium]|nr:beta-lactamase family protein [Chloroflexales bacterium]